MQPLGSDPFSSWYLALIKSLTRQQSTTRVETSNELLLSKIGVVAKQSAASTEEAASSTTEQSESIGNIADAAKALSDHADQLLLEVSRFNTESK